MGSSYDVLAPAYRALWEPVLAPSARGLLDRCDQVVARLAATPSGDAPTLVDVGTGAGVVAVDAVRRWSHVHVHATDPSAAMLDAARARATSELSRSELDRLTFSQAPADRLPFSDGSVDMVLSSFVYQLVPDRVAALREAYRVLKPGGWIGFVTWVVDRAPFPPADAFDDALDAFDIAEPVGDGDTVSGDYASARAAVAQLRRVGFARVRAEAARLEHRWDVDSYLATQERLWEAELMASLDPNVRERLLADARERLSRLDADAFRWHPPIVYVLGTRSATGRRPLRWRRR
ncbi:MAG: class I SAM-dependent methyltransferase [Chloroflexota bacterium]|nr:class I SAM-dependent methyltransferase [Chloroflexota bacterium]